MSDGKPSKYREGIKFSVSSRVIKRGKLHCHEDVNMILPNRWIVKGVERDGKEFIFPIRKDAQQSKENAEDMMKHVKRKGGSVSIFEESWDSVDNCYKRVNKDGN